MKNCIIWVFTENTPKCFANYEKNHYYNIHKNFNYPVAIFLRGQNKHRQSLSTCNSRYLPYAKVLFFIHCNDKKWLIHSEMQQFDGGIKHFSGHEATFRGASEDKLKFLFIASENMLQFNKTIIQGREAREEYGGVETLNMCYIQLNFHLIW